MIYKVVTNEMMNNYMNFIFALQDGVINVNKTITVKFATCEVTRRKPEKNFRLPFCD